MFKKVLSKYFQGQSPPAKATGQFFLLLKSVSPPLLLHKDLHRSTWLHSSKNAIHKTLSTSQSNHMSNLMFIWSLASCKQAPKILPLWWLSIWSTAETAPYLLASRALISSISPLPPKGSGPFPRPLSVLDEAEPPPPPLELEESSPCIIHEVTADVHIKL